MKSLFHISESDYGCEYICGCLPLSTVGLDYVFQECYRPCWTGGDLGFGGRLQRHHLPAGGAIASMVREMCEKSV